MTNSKLDLTAMLAAQMQGNHFGPQDPESYDKPTNIVVAGNGVFRVVKTPTALFKTKIASTETGHTIPGVPTMEEGPELLVPKIPLKYLIMMLTWYRDVYDKDRTEASTLFFWNHNEVELPSHYAPVTIAEKNAGIGAEVKGVIEDGQLIVYCPQQKNSGTLSEFHQDGMVNWLRENTTPFAEFHSHHTMDAYFSGTDNANENMTQFYGVWGKIKQEDPKIAFRWVCGDKKVDIDPSVLFDIPMIEIKTETTVKVTRTVPGEEPVVDEVTEEVIKYEMMKGPWERVEAPEDWMGQHSKSWSYAGGYNKGKTGGATPSKGYGGAGYGGYGYDYDYPYEGYGAGYGGTGSYGTSGASTHSKHSTSNHETTPLKKNGISGSKASQLEIGEVGETEVEIFLEQHLGNGVSIVEAEETVREIVNELIDFGYDHIIADAISENAAEEHM